MNSLHALTLTRICMVFQVASTYVMEAMWVDGVWCGALAVDGTCMHVSDVLVVLVVGYMCCMCFGWVLQSCCCTLEGGCPIQWQPPASPHQHMDPHLSHHKASTHEHMQHMHKCTTLHHTTWHASRHNVSQVVVVHQMPQHLLQAPCPKPLHHRLHHPLPAQ